MRVKDPFVRQIVVPIARGPRRTCVWSLNDESSVWRKAASNELKQVEHLILAEVLDYVKGGNEVEVFMRFPEVFT